MVDRSPKFQTTPRISKPSLPITFCFFERDPSAHLECSRAATSIPVESGDIFWKRWTKEYLPCLQERQRWSKVQRNHSVGDIVLVADEGSPRNTWPLGRIVEVQRNKKDNLVRSVKVTTKNTTLEHPVTKIVLLETVEHVEGGQS